MSFESMPLRRSVITLFLILAHLRRAAAQSGRPSARLGSPLCRTRFLVFQYGKVGSSMIECMIAQSLGAGQRAEFVRDVSHVAHAERAAPATAARVCAALPASVNTHNFDVARFVLDCVRLHGDANAFWVISLARELASRAPSAVYEHMGTASREMPQASVGVQKIAAIVRARVREVGAAFSRFDADLARGRRPRGGEGQRAAVRMPRLRQEAKRLRDPWGSAWCNRVMHRNVCNFFTDLAWELRYDVGDGDAGGDRAGARNLSDAAVVARRAAPDWFPFPFDPVRRRAVVRAGTRGATHNLLLLRLEDQRHWPAIVQDLDLTPFGRTKGQCQHVNVRSGGSRPFYERLKAHLNASWTQSDRRDLARCDTQRIYPHALAF